MKNAVVAITLFLNPLIGFGQYDDKFYAPTKELEKMDSLNYEYLYFPVDQQDTVTSILIQPDDPIKATIIYFHGSGGNVSTYISYVRPFIKDGFQVVMVDFRGYGKSTGKPTHLNIAHDAQIIVDSLFSRQDITQKQVILYGVSMGTQIATHVAKNNQDKVSGLVLDGTLSSFTDIAVESAPKAMKKMIASYVASPYSAKEDIKLITSDIPILMIHSKEDKAIPYTQAEVVFQNANEPKTFWTYTGDHLEAPFKHPVEMVKKVNELIESEYEK